MTPTERHEMIRQQVFSKVHWGTEESEVLQWLTQKGIPDDEAEKMYKDALIAKAAYIRRRAVMMIVFSSIGTVVGLALVAYSFTLDATIRKMTTLGYLIAGPSIVCLIANVAKLLTGKCDGPVE